MSLQLAVEAKELEELRTAWGHHPLERVELRVNDPFLTGEHQLLASRGRRAEICYVMHRGDPQAGVLLHIKSFYPEGAFRLPTGGIHVNETVIDTLGREIAEETGLVVGDASDQVHIDRLLGVLAYDLHHPALGTVPFATYHFLVRMPAGATLQPQDDEEHIAGWAWRPASQLADVADLLEAVQIRSATWADWGRYRALSHRFVAKQLQTAQ